MERDSHAAWRDRKRALPLGAHHDHGRQQRGRQVRRLPDLPPRGACGRAAINWVAEVRLHEGAAVAQGSWNRQGRVEDVLPHFAAWRFSWLDIPALIAAAPVIFEYPMIDRDPLPSWGAGRITLLGDAAHPMYPVGSNGASQAILDARVLAWHLAQTSAPEEALAAYEAARRPPTSSLVLANRAMGADRVLSMVEQRAPAGFARIEDVLSREELEEMGRSYTKMIGTDVEELNARPSWSVRFPDRRRWNLSILSVIGATIGGLRCHHRGTGASGPRHSPPSSRVEQSPRVEQLFDVARDSTNHHGRISARPGRVTVQLERHEGAALRRAQGDRHRRRPVADRRGCSRQPHKHGAEPGDEDQAGGLTHRARTRSQRGRSVRNTGASPPTSVSKSWQSGLIRVSRWNTKFMYAAS